MSFNISTCSLPGSPICVTSLMRFPYVFYSYSDDYVLEDLELTVADYVQRAMKANFAAAWEEMGATNELEETYALSSVKSLEEGVKNIIQVK